MGGENTNGMDKTSEEKELCEILYGNQELYGNDLPLSVTNAPIMDNETVCISSLLHLTEVNGKSDLMNLWVSNSLLFLPYLLCRQVFTGEGTAETEQLEQQSRVHGQRNQEWAAVSYNFACFILDHQEAYDTVCNLNLEADNAEPIVEQSSFIDLYSGIPPESFISGSTAGCALGSSWTHGQDIDNLANNEVYMDTASERDDDSLSSIDIPKYPRPHSMNIAIKPYGSEVMVNALNGIGNVYNFGEIHDLDLHPRMFRHHRYSHTMKSRNPIDHLYEYRVNNQCPPSPDNSHLIHECDMAKKHAAMYRFSRKDHQNGVQQFLCRFCMGYRWFSSKEYKQHLLFAHGILTPKILKHMDERVNSCTAESDINHSTAEMIRLLPLPERLYENNDDKFQHIVVQCPICHLWMMLGNSFDGSVVMQNLFGLYDRYFYHVANCQMAHLTRQSQQVQSSQLVVYPEPPPTPGWSQSGKEFVDQ